MVTAAVLALADLPTGPALASPATKSRSTALPALTAKAPTTASFPPNINVCKVGGTAPCDASTQHAPVYLYPRSGDPRENIGIVTVQIKCYYLNGTPVVNGDSTEDHVVQIIQLDGFVRNVDGHVPDYNVDLGGHNPADDNIPKC